ncbi:MAG: hypothetical protein ACI4MR_06590, partial [Candidatus Aphodomorpha sp.]
SPAPAGLFVFVVCGQSAAPTAIRYPRAPAFYAQPFALRNRMQGLSAQVALLRRSTASAGRIFIERMIEPECIKVFLCFFSAASQR